MIKMKSSKSFWISLISLLFFLPSCNKYSVYWNDLRNTSNKENISITFKNENTGKLKDIILISNKTSNITIPPNYYDEGYSHPYELNFQYFIDYDEKKIELYLIDTCTNKVTGNKFFAETKDYVFGYKLIYTDLENDNLVTVISKDSIFEIPPERLRFDSENLTMKDLLNFMEHKDICYIKKIDKNHLMLYPSASISYLVKGKVLNEFYWISSNNSGSIDYYINRSILPAWMKKN